MLFPILWPLKNLCVAGNDCFIDRVRGTSLLKRYGTTSLDRVWKGGDGGSWFRVAASFSREFRIPYFFLAIPNPAFVYQKRQFLQKLIKCNLYIGPFDWYFQFARVFRLMIERNSFSQLSMVKARDTTTWWVVLYAWALCPWYKDFPVAIL